MTSPLKIKEVRSFLSRNRLDLIRHLETMVVQFIMEAMRKVFGDI
jgi:hypothetical protein